MVSLGRPVSLLELLLNDGKGFKVSTLLDAVSMVSLCRPVSLLELLLNDDKELISATLVDDLGRPVSLIYVITIIFRYYVLLII